jgi:hypothetical protein
LEEVRRAAAELQGSASPRQGLQLAIDELAKENPKAKAITPQEAAYGAPNISQPLVYA